MELSQPDNNDSSSSRNGYIYITQRILKYIAIYYKSVWMNILLSFHNTTNIVFNLKLPF